MSTTTPNFWNIDEGLKIGKYIATAPNFDNPFNSYADDLKIITRYAEMYGLTVYATDEFGAPIMEGDDQ